VSTGGKSLGVVGIITVLFVVVRLIFALVLVIERLVVVGFTGVVENSAWYDAVSQRLAHFEVGVQQHSGLLVQVGFFFRRVDGRVEEVEEAVGLDLLGDESSAAGRLVFLLLLYQLHRHVLTLLPIDLAALAGDNLRAIVLEGIILIRVALEGVLLGQLLVREVLIRLEVEEQGEASRVGVHFDADIGEMVENGLVMFLDHLGEKLDVLEEGEPELRDTLDVGGGTLIPAREQLRVILVGQPVDERVVRLCVRRLRGAGDDVASLVMEPLEVGGELALKIVDLLVELGLELDAAELELLEGAKAPLDGGGERPEELFVHRLLEQTRSLQQVTQILRALQLLLSHVHSVLRVRVAHCRGAFTVVPCEFTIQKKS